MTESAKAAEDAPRMTPTPIYEMRVTLKAALRIPALPFPDPVAHSTEAYARAVHSAYCAVRFKVIDAIEQLDKLEAEVAALRKVAEAAYKWGATDTGDKDALAASHMGLCNALIDNRDAIDAARSGERKE